jgi:hypothetical protein
MIRIALLLMITALLAGCGSGGSGGSSTSGDGRGLGPSSTSSSANVTVGALAPAADIVIYGVEFTINLPSGASVAADPSTGETATGLIHTTDSRAFSGGKYTPATATTPATLKLVITDSSGFTAGDLATISCSIAAGSAVTPAGFSLAGFSARGADGAPLSGVTPRLSVLTQ